MVLAGRHRVSLRNSISNKINNRGFSLLEVMVALTVAAIALSVLVQGLSRYANYFIYLRDKIITQTIAVGELTHKSLDYEYVIPEYIERGGARWELVYEEEEYFFRELEDLKEIRVSVIGEDGNSVITLSTIVRSSTK